MWSEGGHYNMVDIAGAIPILIYQYCRILGGSRPVFFFWCVWKEIDKIVYQGNLECQWNLKCHSFPFSVKVMLSGHSKITHEWHSPGSCVSRQSLFILRLASYREASNWLRPFIRDNGQRNFKPQYNLLDKALCSESIGWKVLGGGCTKHWKNGILMKD